MSSGGFNPMRDGAATDVIAGLSLPSFVVVASVLTLALAVLAGQVQPDAAATPAAVVRVPERQPTMDALSLPGPVSSAPRPAR